MNKFGPMFDADITENTHKLIQEGSKLKDEIFRTITMNKELDKYVIRYYLSYINEFLRYWDEYSSYLGDQIKCTTPTEGIQTLDYEFIKAYVYANHDYASILSFTDHIIGEVEANRFTKPSDIENYFAQTIQKSFHQHTESVAELLDSVLEEGIYLDNHKLVTKREAQLFQSIRRYNGLFDHRARSVLYNSIDKVLDCITKELPSIKMSLDYKVIRLFVSIVNNIVEYITYSLTAFSTRIYIISRYAYPFINSYKAGPSFKESVDNSYGSGITILRDIDDLLVKDPSKLKDLCDVYNKFLTTIGSDDFGSHKPNYSAPFIGDIVKKSNRFCSKMLVNPLYQLLTTDRFQNFSPYSVTDSMITELHQLLKTYLYNEKQGIQISETPKQEILHIIRGEEPKENTLNGYKTIAKDLYILILNLAANLASFINDLIKCTEKESMDHNHPISTLNRMTECLHMVTELYRDIIGAMIAKGRHIEQKINEFQKHEIDQMRKEISISIPGQKESDISLSNNMMCAAPATIRMPMKLIDIYAEPHYEHMHLYHEYLKESPEFSLDPYFTEGTISNLIDLLFSKLMGLRKRVVSFFNNKATQAAFKWVNDHEKELKEITFDANDKIDQCYPLKKEIGLPPGWNNLLHGLEKFKEDSIKDQESLYKFIETLYPSPNIYRWFTDKKFEKNGKQMGAQMFRNLVLFQDSNHISMEPLQPVTFQGNQLREQFQEWIDTVKAGNEIYKSYLDLDKKVMDAMNKVKEQLINMSKQETSSTNSSQNQNTNQQDQSSIESPNTNTHATMSDNQTSNDPKVTVGNNKSGNNTESGSLADTAINEITKVMSNIWIPMGDMICQAIKQEYKYLKMVYNAKRTESEQ